MPQAEPGNTKILIVDDELGPRMSLKVLLSKQSNYLCLLAGDHEAAIGLLNEHPDIKLAILDLRMPVMGPDLLSILRRSSPDLRAILFTAWNDLAGSEQDQRLSALGFNALLNKPSSEATVVETVAKALSEPARPITKSY